MNHLTNVRLHFAMYPHPDVPPWLVARIAWDQRGDGASLELRADLTPREQLRALSWASAILPGYLWPDGAGYAVGGTTPGPVLAAREINRYGRAIRLIVCIECGFDFDPDSSPHLDRCWACAEEFDAEACR